MQHLPWACNEHLRLQSAAGSLFSGKLSLHLGPIALAELAGDTYGILVT
jgi:hypothetical protein